VNGQRKSKAPKPAEQSSVEKMALIKALLIELRTGDRLEVIGEFCSDCGVSMCDPGHTCQDWNDE
jgi:hypothetical protein